MVSFTMNTTNIEERTNRLFLRPRKNQLFRKKISKSSFYHRKIQKNFLFQNIYYFFKF